MGRAANGAVEIPTLHLVDDNTTYSLLRIQYTTTSLCSPRFVSAAGVPREPVFRQGSSGGRLCHLHLHGHVFCEICRSGGAKPRRSWPFLPRGSTHIRGRCGRHVIRRDAEFGSVLGPGRPKPARCTHTHTHTPHEAFFNIHWYKTCIQNLSGLASRILQQPASSYGPCLATFTPPKGVPKAPSNERLL